MKKALILIAEDLDSNFLFLKIVLSKQHDIIWAKDGVETVKLFEEHNPDLILMDIKMPNMDGLEATRAIRAISTSVPIIAQTANAFESDHQKALEAGCTDVITKPIKIVHLINMIEKYLPKVDEGKVDKDKVDEDKVEITEYFNKVYKEQYHD